MVSSKESFSTLSLSKGPNIHMGDDSQIPTEGRGSARAKHGEFKNVLYVPSLAVNLLSIYQMTHTGSPKRVTFDSDSVKITEKSTGKLVAKLISNHSTKAYEFSHFLPISPPTALLSHANNTIKIWHEIFGHLNFKYLKLLHNDKMVEGFRPIQIFDGVCVGFLVGKHPENKYDFGKEHRAASTLYLIHSDVAEHMPTKSINFCRYFLTFINDCSRYC